MIPENKAFILKDGRRIYGLRELANVLQTLDRKVFTYHVNEQKNDFARWITDVLRSPAVAERLQGITEPETMGDIIRVSVHRKELEREQERFQASLDKVK